MYNPIQSHTITNKPMSSICPYPLLAYPIYQLSPVHLLFYPYSINILSRGTNTRGCFKLFISFFKAFTVTVFLLHLLPWHQLCPVKVYLEEVEFKALHLPIIILVPGDADSICLCAKSLKANLNNGESDFIC